MSTDRDFERWMTAKQRNKTALSEEKGVSSRTDAESEGAWRQWGELVWERELSEKVVGDKTGKMG